jgi:MFS family permease
VTDHTAGTEVENSHGGSRHAAHPTLILLLIAGAQLMVILDATIVNIALPSMGRYFDKTQTDMTWAINAYTLAFGGLLLLGGRAGDILGRRQMFITGLALFSIGSFLGGIAPNFQLLLAGRVLQGIGGAIASPTALSLITTNFDEGKERNRAFGVYAAVSGAGAALGLLLGGILTEYLDWRWVLFVNVPIGLLLIVGAFFYLPASERLTGKFDFFGALLSVAGMVALVYGFINAARNGWSTGVTIGCLLGGVVLLVAFVMFEMRTPEPMMPMRIFGNRSRAGAYLVMLIIGAAMFGMFYFLTFFVQGVMGYSALKAGVAFVPVSAVIIIGSGIVAQLMPKVGPKILISTGAVFGDDRVVLLLDRQRRFDLPRQDPARHVNSRRRNVLHLRADHGRRRHQGPQHRHRPGFGPAQRRAAGRWVDRVVSTGYRSRQCCQELRQVAPGRSAGPGQLRPGQPGCTPALRGTVAGLHQRQAGQHGRYSRLTSAAHLQRGASAFGLDGLPHRRHHGRRRGHRCGGHHQREEGRPANQSGRTGSHGLSAPPGAVNIR